MRKYKKKLRKSLHYGCNIHVYRYNIQLVNINKTPNLRFTNLFLVCM